MTMPAADACQRSLTGVRSLGVVSFLNARPLVETLAGRDDVIVRPAVPAALEAMLDAGECDVALLPVVDYWRNRDRLQPVSDACIASDGETLTVRVYSRVPPDRITRVHGDTHSHTSVVLARLIWRELYGRSLDIPPFDADAPAVAADGVEAVLLIGDKVVCNRPRGFGFEVDLGAAWKHLTGLPFVFAAWYGPRGRDLAPLASLLESARDAGVADAARIAREQAPLHGWPEPLAIRYLVEIMQYTITDPMRRAMTRFFEGIETHGLSGSAGADCETSLGSAVS